MRIQLLVTMAVVVFLFSCGGRTHVIPGKGNATLGQTSFAQHCISCHTDPLTLEDSTRDEVMEALLSVPAMQPIQLSADDLDNIVAYFATISPAHNPDPVAGQTVWSTSCSGCHSNASTYAGYTVSQLQAALALSPMTGITLTPDQFADIAAYLGTLSPTGNAANGQTFFSAHCTGCHTPASLSGRTAAQLQAALALSPMTTITATPQDFLDLVAYLATT